MDTLRSKTRSRACCLILLLSMAGNRADTTAVDKEDEALKQQRLRMVATQIERRGVKNERVLDTMRKVPRHLFVPLRERRSAYADGPLPIGHGQTISQPYIVAFMTDLLDPKPDHKVLEVGTGSGYQAAVLAELVSKVYTIEIIEALGKPAKERLKKLGYDNVEVKVADGYHGWEEHAPFDSIIVTCAASHVPPPLIKQLKIGGKMCIPVGTVFGPQHLIIVTKQKDGTVKVKSVLPVRFVPLVGHDKPAETR
jgi:protein-L-isoaspartate(D-aspartate) O-methyltransferase